MPGLHHEFVKTRLCCSLLRAFFKCWQLTLVRGEPLGHCLGHPMAQLVWERACRGCSPLSFRHLAVSGSVVVSQRPWADPTEWQFCTRPNEVDHQQSSGLSSHSSQSALVQVHHLHSRQACQVGHLLQLPHAELLEPYGMFNNHANLMALVWPCGAVAPHLNKLNGPMPSP